MESASFEVPGSSSIAPAATESDTETNTLAQNTDHVSEGISHLIEFFRQGPRNQALLTALLTQVQECEDALWDILGAWDLDTATGDQLDILGRVVGEPRAGRSDTDYRAAIRVRVLVNSSDGTPEQLYAIVDGMVPGATVELTEFAPASAIYEISSTIGSVSFALIAALVKKAKPAGVQVDTVYGLSSSSLMWADADAADTTTGWGSDADDTLGGGFSLVA